MGIKKDKTLQTSQNNNQVEPHPRARIFAHIVITILFLVLVIGAVSVYVGFWDKTRDYTPVDHANSTFFYGIEQGKIFPVSLDYYVHLNTTSLSAQNQINVEAKAYAGQTYREFVSNEWGTLPDEMCLAFPNALPYQEQPNNAGGFYGVGIPMYKDKVNRWYEGHGSIIYPFEGQYGYAFLDVNNTGLNNPTCNQTPHLYNTTKIKKSIQDDDKFFVGSTSLTDALRTNDITTALTMILIAFGFLEFRGIIRSGFIWLAEWRSKRKAKKEEIKSKEGQN